MSNTREKALIDSVVSGKEDHGILTCSIGCKMLAGSYQSFGNLALDENLLLDFHLSLCQTFNIYDIKNLVGKECYVLRSFDSYNEYIEGLEAIPSGKRFTLTAWRKKHFPSKTVSKLEERTNSLKSSIESYKRRIREIQAQLKNLKNIYVDWEK